jgi:hypothetical protein
MPVKKHSHEVTFATPVIPELVGHARPKRQASLADAGSPLRPRRKWSQLLSAANGTSPSPIPVNEELEVEKAKIVNKLIEQGKGLSEIKDFVAILFPSRVIA